MAKNERETENIVRDKLREFGYYSADNSVQVEEQKSNIESIKKLLKSASKSGKGGSGFPEFIITSPTDSDFVIIVECKADYNNHSSKEAEDFLLDENDIEETKEQYTKRTQRYAVDGILHYAKYLSKEYNVISIAVSGNTDTTVNISTFLNFKGNQNLFGLQMM